MLCCFAAAVAEWPDGRLPFVDVDKVQADISCNRQLSVVHQGYHLESTGDSSWACTPCATIVEAATACPADSQFGATRAQSIYAKSETPDRRDYCAHTATFGWECLACTPGVLAGPPRPHRPRVGATLHISSSCQHVEPNGRAWVDLGPEHSNLTIYGHGGVMQVSQLPVRIGQHFSATSVTICPRNTSETCDGTNMGDLANATYVSPWPSLLGPADPVAIELTEPGDAVLDRVFAPTARALLSARPRSGTEANMAIGNLSVVGAARGFVVALSHVTVETSSVECRGKRNHVLVQERRGSDLEIVVAEREAGASSCRNTIDLSALMAAYGRQYEVLFYHNGVARKTAPLLVGLFNRALAYAAVILGVFIVFAHEGDVRRLIRKSATSA